MIRQPSMYDRSNLWGEFSGEKRRRWPKHAGANAATHATCKTTKGSACVAASEKSRTLESPKLAPVPAPIPVPALDPRDAAAHKIQAWWRRVPKLAPLKYRQPGSFDRWSAPT